MREAARDDKQAQQQREVRFRALLRLSVLAVVVLDLRDDDAREPDHGPLAELFSELHCDVALRRAAAALRRGLRAVVAVALLLLPLLWHRRAVEICRQSPSVALRATPFAD